MGDPRDFSTFVDDRTHLADDDGNPIVITNKNLSLNKEHSQWYSVSPGKVEARTRVSFSYEVPATSIMKVAIVEVADHAKGGQFRVPVTILPGYSSVEIDWANVSAIHEYKEGKRVFTITLTNWSHDYGRDCRLYLEYDI
ncbi:hypothetical protein [Azospirillum argentinense]